ncbi:MAG: hypothetical protein ER33_07800 [Cyanobium sp. CACIAM 14]|nr:MAG: hypothetical protein ER33_07800 [Cyanobium sp. CACIAM 14]
MDSVMARVNTGEKAGGMSAVRTGSLLRRIAPLNRSGGVPFAAAFASVLLGGMVLGAVGARAAVMGAARALPYPEAVSRTHDAAEAVLAGAGAETCLRGKLTNALVGLSSSCEANGERNALCRLADSAAVVTPMTLAFMRETATRLLALIDSPDGAATPKGGPASARP